jgi:hypothetical protein
MRHVVGATLVSVMNAITSLLVDLVPNQGSSITACVSLRLLYLSEVLIFFFRLGRTTSSVA